MGKKWSSVSITGYKAGSPADDGSATEANKVKFSTIYTDLTDPIKTGVDTIVSNLDAVFTQANTATSTNYTTVASDHATWLEVTDTKTITLLAAATAGAGYQVGVKNVGVGVVTVARSSTDTIDGATDVGLQAQASGLYVVNAAGDGYVDGNTQPYANKNAAEAYLSAAQTIVGTGWEKVLLNTEKADYGGEFNTSTNRYVAGQIGTYIVTGKVVVNNVAADKFAQASIYLNGTILSQGTKASNGIAGDQVSIAYAIVDMFAGSYVELYGRTDDTGKEFLNDTGFTVLTVVRLA